jgi:EpsI family protein
MPGRLEGVLAADDYIMRTYRNEEGLSAALFIAYYKALQGGQGPHSPKNCLPGSGWEPVQNDRVELGVDAGGRPLWVNRYFVEKDAQRSLVLYWYQARGRTIASEYWSLIYLIWDASLTRRRDDALVRITVPIRQGTDGGAESDAALDLARASLPELPRFLPN